MDKIKHFKRESGASSINKFLQTVKETGILNEVFEVCESFNLVKVKSMAELDETMKDPVFSFVSEVR
jgi:hypothetical protein